MPRALPPAGQPAHKHHGRPGEHAAPVGSSHRDQGSGRHRAGDARHGGERHPPCGTGGHGVDRKRDEDQHRAAHTDGGEQHDRGRDGGEHSDRMTAPQRKRHTGHHDGHGSDDIPSGPVRQSFVPGGHPGDRAGADQRGEDDVERHPVPRRDPLGKGQGQAFVHIPTVTPPAPLRIGLQTHDRRTSPGVHGGRTARAATPRRRGEKAPPGGRPGRADPACLFHGPATQIGPKGTTNMTVHKGASR
jgi:hypothetical protein